MESSSPEARFNALQLGITWDEFGDLDRPDLDAILDVTEGLDPAQRGKVVSMWKRHPNRQTGIFLRYTIYLCSNNKHYFCFILFVFHSEG
jgi:hypothetical protein